MNVRIRISIIQRANDSFLLRSAVIGDGGND